MAELPELKFSKSGAPIVQNNCHRQLLKSRRRREGGGAHKGGFPLERDFPSTSFRFNKSPLPHSETGRRKPSFFYGGNSMAELPELKFSKSGAPIVQSNCHRQLLKSRLGGKGWRSQGMGVPAGAGFHPAAAGFNKSHLLPSSLKSTKKGELIDSPFINQN